MEFGKVKIVVYVPVESADLIRQVLADSGAGHIGNYSHCSFSVKGVGRFKGEDGANPVTGEVGKIEEVEEERVEVICEKGRWEEVVDAVKKAHPYEEPAIDVVPILN